jgi:hypothetical protein
MKADELIAAIQQVQEFSISLNSTSWIWGGLTADVYQGEVLRDHHDLDYLTLNLHDIFTQVTVKFQNAGWLAQPLSNGDLKLEKDGVKVHLGHVTIGQDVRWTHNGDLGSLYFPVKWLPQAVKKFYDLEVHVIAPQLQYVLLEHPELLNPAWELRNKDRIAKAYFENYLENSGVAVEGLKTQIHD